MTRTCEIRPSILLPLRDVPILTVGEFRTAVLTGVAAGARVAALFGRPWEPDAVQLIAVLADGLTGTLSVAATVVSDTYPSTDARLPTGALV